MNGIMKMIFSAVTDVNSFFLCNFFRFIFRICSSKFAPNNYIKPRFSITKATKIG